MYNNGLTLNEVGDSPYTIGTTDFVTYTCSGGAKFFLDKTKTDNDIAIFFETSNDQQVVTSQIQNLDSIVVRYVSKSTEKRISVAYSTNGVDGWVELTTQQIDGVIAKGVKMPQVGDYYLRFMRFRDDVYIKQIDYFCLDPLSGCPNCFIYKP